jgi:uncharacterized protein (UPF0210 family)
MTAPLTPTNHLVSEADVKWMLDEARKEDRETIRDLTTKLKAAEFRAQIAEWAVAGVASWNVRIAVQPEELHADERKLLDMVRYIGRNAAEQLLHSAKLHFQQHAEHYELMSNTDPSRFINLMGSEKEIPGKPFWPQPKGKP